MVGGCGKLWKVEDKVGGCETIFETVEKYQRQRNTQGSCKGCGKVLKCDVLGESLEVFRWL